MENNTPAKTAPAGGQSTAAKPKTPSGLLSVGKVALLFIAGAIPGAIAGLFLLRPQSTEQAAASGGGGIAGIIFSTAAILVLFYAAFLVHVIIHEAGHMAAGRLSGYSFLSFRIGSVLFYKDGERLKCKRFRLPAVAGAGQCLMLPPTPDKRGFVPFILYNTGGAAANFLAAGLFMGVYFLTKGSFTYAAHAFLPLVVIGLFAGFTNIIPIKSMMNDGYNMRTISGSQAANRGFQIMMSTQAEIFRGKRVRDLPAEWFAPPYDYTSHISAYPAIAYIGVLQDDRRYDEVRRFAEELLEQIKDLNAFYTNTLAMEALFAELVTDARVEEIKRLYTPELDRFIKQTKYLLPTQRVAYAYALIAEKDETKAAEVKERFEKLAKNYPYAGDLESEREMLEKAAESIK